MYNIYINLYTHSNLYDKAYWQFYKICVAWFLIENQKCIQLGIVTEPVKFGYFIIRNLT